MKADATLRDALVSQLERSGVLHAPAVAAAMRGVPRHLFVPGVTLEEAYADRAIALKSRGDEIVSSISQPGMIAQMLELLDPMPGESVLEIGTGSGYNAALLCELVGPKGRITTVEIDPELAGHAAATLRELGYENVQSRVADGTAALDETAFDRVVVTARADDIGTGWWDAVPDGARLVVPLRLTGAGEYAIGFVRRGRRLLSIGSHPCAFIALRGDTATDAGDVFYRDPERASGACTRRIHDVIAVRSQDATPALLDDADVVVARPVTIFAVRFA